MSSFERRGLPFRDAFDSAFDEVVHVHYLDFRQACELVQRRVIGFPRPFMAVAHCVSGGLARDLIRACREIVDLGTQSDSPLHISRVATSVVSLDLEAKLHAMALAAKDCIPQAGAAALLAGIREVQAGPVSAALLLEAARRTATAEGPVAPSQPNEPEASRLGRQKLERLRDELAAYLVYCATILEVFGERFEEGTLAELESDGSLELVAKARQDFAVSAQLARATLDLVRQKRGMAPSCGERADAPSGGAS